jgi:hypothetical protein
MSIYIKHNQGSFNTETDKVMFAISYLEGSAFEFIETYLDDYNSNPPKKQREDTRSLFADVRYFIKVLKEVYGETFEKEKATQKLMALKMHKHYPEYLAHFLQLAPRVDMDENALKAFFYKGLTDQLKDELMRFPKSTSLIDLRTKVMEIWTRLRERSMEKHQQPDPYRSQHHGSHTVKTAASWENKDKKKGKKGGYQGKPKDGSTKKEGNCHNCGKPGHWARECRGPKKQQVAMAVKTKGPATGANRQPIEKKTVAMYEYNEEVFDEPDDYDGPLESEGYCRFTVQDCDDDECEYHLEEKQDIFTAERRARGIGPDGRQQPSRRPCLKDQRYCTDPDCQTHLPERHRRELRQLVPLSPTEPPPAYLVNDTQQECTRWVWHCFDASCVTHEWQKGLAEYWPQQDIKESALIRIDQDYSHLEDNLHYKPTIEEAASLAKPEHAELRWTMCEIGSCLFHVGDKIRHGFMASPYHYADDIVEEPFTTEQRKHWFQMQHYTRGLGDEPAKVVLTDKEKENDECTSNNAARCTAYACREHRATKEIRGYYPELWTGIHKEYVWDKEYSSNLSNLFHKPGEMVAKLALSKEHQELHWTNCIIGWCPTHNIKKLLNEYIPSAADIHIRKAHKEGTSSELKELTLQLQGW